ncbi:MAG TPA: SCO family protein [Crocinitomicaceae bacterium]|nr:SCO family protein [Crocinitomicaceae bacterium]
MKNFLIVAVTTIVGIIIGYFILKQNNHLQFLPIINPIDVDSSMVESSLQDKGVGHVVQPFSFKDQHNQTVTNELVKGKIWVAEYFFTTCQSICPVMNQEMMNVQKAFKNDDKVKILSFTVDPEIDTPEKLNDYAKNHHADENQWYFLTGKKEELYAFARQSIFVLKPAEASNLGDAGSDFIHTNNFVLIDGQGRIRGYYDGTNSDEVKQLITDIRTLKNEEEN